MREEGQLPRLAKTKTDSSPDPRGFMQGKCIPIYEVHNYVCLFLPLNSNHSPLLVTVICSLSPTETWQNKFTIIWWSSIYVGTDVIFKSSKGSRIKMWLQKQVDLEFLHWPSSGWMESWSQLKDCQILAKFPKINVLPIPLQRERHWAWFHYRGFQGCCRGCRFLRRFWYSSGPWDIV